MLSNRAHWPRWDAPHVRMGIGRGPLVGVADGFRDTSRRRAFSAYATGAVAANHTVTLYIHKTFSVVKSVKAGIKGKID